MAERTTEKTIEADLIRKLEKDLKYTYRSDIKDRDTLERNFREKFNALNRVELSDREFSRLLEQMITGDVFQAAKKLREINTLERDDGTSLNFTLVNLKDWCKNTFEVVNQLRINTHNSHHCYDVVLLMSGLPVVQIELKALGVVPQKAMRQIVDYKNDPGNGYGNTLMCFLQMFIVSNRSSTWYFANNNRRHFSFGADERFLPIYRFARENNQKVERLDDFADEFLAKCTLAEMTGRYMVLVASEEKLLMMRPYQIYAVKKMMDCIHQNHGNGYIWHTTGSGKTLTSFRAATLMKDNPDIEKCLFVVDRKDLDKQTREEFNKFQRNCVEENTDTKTLVNRLLSDQYADKVIVTTIQKLGLALDEGNKNSYRERLKPLQGKRVVFIFDECHRSQFGENHRAIREFFPNSQLFGFTGTPIFKENAAQAFVDLPQTTEDIFQNPLHDYTITDAIEDGNVLRFLVEYYKPKDESGPLPKKAVVKSILKHHDAKTGKRKFNAILATASINDAIEYYELFKEIQADRKKEDPEFESLNVACVFSPPSEGNKDIQQIQEDLIQEKDDNAQEPDKKKAALKAIIQDYNDRYGTNCSLGEFDLYYQDIQGRIKKQEFPNQDFPRGKKIDLVIVVDMLLTGFDSKYLNTLYVDKNLKYHGLIQAFSRTNRILNGSKPWGNILDFRRQEAAVDEAIGLFSGRGNKASWLVEGASEALDGLKSAVSALSDFMHLRGLKGEPSKALQLKGDMDRIEFVNLFRKVQRHKTQIDQYTDLTEAQEKEVEALAPQDWMQGFRGVYLEIAQALKSRQGRPDEKPTQGPDREEPVQEAFDLDLVLFNSALIDYDYIMKLMAGLTQQGPQSITRERILSLIASDSKFMDDRADLEAFVNTLKEGERLDEKSIEARYNAFKDNKRNTELEQIARTHQIDPRALQAFVERVLERMIFDDDGLTDFFSSLDLPWAVRDQKKLDLMAELAPFLRRLAGARDISGLNAYE